MAQFSLYIGLHVHKEFTKSFYLLILTCMLVARNSPSVKNIVRWPNIGHDQYMLEVFSDIGGPISIICQK